MMVWANCLLLAGPTAAGKSEAALLAAQKLSGEIISVDSMQVYRGLDIGTAKPSLEDRERIAHHLIDIANLDEHFSAADFVSYASRAVNVILQRGKTPILCGGTGFYFRALLEGLGEAPPADAELRATLEQTPREELLEELKRRDPVTYEAIDRRNPRRIIRAVEVIRKSGRPFSEQKAQWARSETGAPVGSDQTEPEPTAHIFCLRRDPDDLARRIEERVDRMFARGLVEETRWLLQQGLRRNRTALQSLGYRQVVEYLDGQRTLPETIALVKRKTRQFARRQMTWFRHQRGSIWIQWPPAEPAEKIADYLAAQYRIHCRPEFRAYN